jgi:acetyltransferase
MRLANVQYVTVRPVRRQDDVALQQFVRNLSARSRNQRFMHGLSELPARVLEQLTRVDQCNHVAYVREGSSDRAELAIAVADHWQGRGLATVLFGRLFEHARSAGIRLFTAMSLASNDRLRLARKAGFNVTRDPGLAGQVRLELQIAPDCWADPRRSHPKLGAQAHDKHVHRQHRLGRAARSEHT